jgi:ribokinase
MKGRVISTGSVIVDMTVRVPALPPVGGDVIASEPEMAVGGGFNLMYAAARQGADVVYGGVVGSGERGRLVSEALSANGIAQGQSGSDSTTDTGLCLTLLDTQAERTFITSPGAEAHLTLEGLQQVQIEDGDWVAVSGYDLVYESAVESLRSWIMTIPRGTHLFIDPGPLALDIDREVWADVVSVVDVLSINDREASLLAHDVASGGAEAVHHAIRRRHQLADEVLLVVRGGTAGCSASGGALDEIIHVPTLTVDAVDTTGAGDAHAGVLLACLAAGVPIAEALLRANVAAALAVTRQGPASAPGAGEIDAALAALTGASVDR